MPRFVNYARSSFAGLSEFGSLSRHAPCALRHAQEIAGNPDNIKTH
jgi:hypothetical protein